MSAPPAPKPATDPRHSAWVSANAGSGKTRLLIDRVSRLLMSGASPTRILCLTYTKAAAAEMSSRLFDRLGQWALLPEAELRRELAGIGEASPSPDMLRHARRLFAQALETPGGLKIQTIHAFCQNLLARFPLEAGIPARFTVLDERSAAELMARARNAVLERAAAGEAPIAGAITILATRADDARFADILDLGNGDAGKLRGLLARHGGATGLLAHLRRRLQIGEDETAESIVAELCEALTGDRERCRAAAEWLRNGSKTDREAGERLAAFAEDLTAAKFASLRAVFVTKEHDPRKNLVTKATAKARPDLEAFLNDLGARVLAAEERRKGAATYELTAAFIVAVGAVLDEYAARKAARAALDYDDLVGRTLALLERGDAAQWVLYKLDGGLDHILVDEAQDTSPEQWRILAMLTEEFFAGAGTREGTAPRTIFAVGDEKQSIFSFQGAEPEEFGRHRSLFKARAEAAALGFVDARPAISMRSAQTILRFVDAVFAEGDIREGLTSAPGPVLHEPERKQPGRVEIWPAVKPPPGAERGTTRPVDAPSPMGAHVLLAAAIARRIQGWLANGTTLPGTDTPIVPEDIMILVRRRGAFADEMIRQLIAQGVPVAGADRMVLLDQIAVMDLVALGRFALLPEDDLNLACLLKSPIVGFGEDDLYRLAQPRQGGLWRELRARHGEDPLFGEAHRLLSESLARADFAPPFEFYAGAVSGALRRRIVARLGDEAADAIDEFLALALAYEASHPPSLEGFLDWLTRGGAEVKRDMEQGGGAVRVMTVHGAKGLEAKVVIVPDTAQIPVKERQAGVLYTDDAVFLAVGKDIAAPAVTAAREAAGERALKEYRRLLYVALTRACDWLIVCGYETKRGVQARSWYEALIEAARKIGREENDDTGASVFVMGDDAKAGTRAARPATAVPSLPAFLSRAPAPEAGGPRILRPSEAAGADEPALLSPVADAGGNRFRRGLLVHALLAALPDVPPAERERVARRHLVRRGIAEDAAGALIRETLAILEDAMFAPLFAEGSRAEVAVTAEMPELGDGVRISGQIDRLAVTDDLVLIADFKTNRPPPAGPEATPSLYRAQMALYRAALAKIYPGRRISCALVWTDGARLMALPEALLEAELAAIRQRQFTQKLV